MPAGHARQAARRVVAERAGVAAPAGRTRRRACGPSVSTWAERTARSSAGEGRADQVDDAGAVGGPHLEHGRLLARPRGGRRPSGARRRGAGPAARRGAGSSRPSTIASNRCRSTAASRSLVGDLPHRDGVARPAPRPARRAPASAAARASPATSASRPTRSCATTVTAAAVGGRSTSTEQPRPRRTVGRDSRHLVGRRWPAATPVSSAAWTRRARSPTSPARHVDQAFGRGGPGVGLGERAQQRQRLGRSPTRRGDELDGGRVVGVAGGGGLGEQQVPAHERADQVDRVGVEAHPGGDGAGDRLARDAVLGQPALADVVQQRRDHEHVGARDRAGSARRPRCRSRRRAGRR